ncbi:FAD-dependent oxidoreductase [Aphanizomenon flos-aquae NRERC-008]|jgi:glycine oxidase|uniref:FAD-binding oxidoreductase n=1 Tax=Aphanizomenon flos-aquae FACHB-1249 TaxID=2692889 RepID=A0ABR8INS9_APHFL|nr:MULTISPECIES: FAD-dependent oxidoreductase [Aphanizomenon]MBD1217409.1 FAD-binding oxidoreductase [Aphanizomenon flos-aquae Clear-A1]OBQ19981.1 MAG: FAD-dependent oxidoreductase [Anabaena sp. WA113]QSV68315.1 MAG: FAD-binding oxidoreductase [Aphanizomenon flos-aquae DEX188]MBD2392141.1 FAD-binding oxidoreductase [Aphanizomenon flos-aquae FACHB-1171]MBD2557987.1 FAD-binding oxidoreductase [Aphanizomenon flos-aquae FACHB-1290]
MNVVIIGCGVVGAAIAYELSQVKGLNITVFEQKQPAQGSTSAALGVLMGIISSKTKGIAWRMRESSIQRYTTLIPELEAITGRKIPCNRQGIVMLLSENLERPLESGVEVLSEWEQLREIRQSQSWELQIWDQEQLQKYCPQVNDPQIIGAVYSPQDLQLNATALTLALVDAAQRNGVNFKFGVSVTGTETPPPPPPTPLHIKKGLGEARKCNFIETTEGKVTADWFIMSAGLGSTALTAQLDQIVNIRPVLGQALYLSLGHSLGNPDFQPVITGNDVHIVPMGNGDYWVGATVEFPNEQDQIPPNQELLAAVRQQAIAFTPDLATAKVLRTWSGLRPRPEGRPAPIIDKLPGFTNVLLATGHYRNGVLLAPATATAIREMILPQDSHS